MKTASTGSEGSFTLKEKLGYAIVGLVVLGGSFFIGRSIVRKARSNAEEKKTFDDANPAAFAQSIKMAFENDNYFGWGTNKEALRAAIRKIPTKDAFKQVMNSYQKLYARSLMADMKDELTASEYTEMLAIIAGKPDSMTQTTRAALTNIQYQAWAKRLKAAFDITYWGIPGTDEPAIKAVFLELPTQVDFQKTAVAYQQAYGTNLITDLKSELEFWEYGPMMDIITKKPKA